MAYENKAGLGVNNQYGARNTGGSVGTEQIETSVGLYSIQLTGEMVNSGFVPPIVVPKGAQVKRAMLRVDEAFSLGGTSPVINIGQKGSESTNGITLSKTELEAVGSKVPASTGNGTWSVSSATGTTAAAQIGIALGGTTPTVSATQGKATLVVEIFNKTKA